MIVPFKAPKSPPMTRFGLLTKECETAVCKKWPTNCEMAKGMTNPQIRQMGFTAIVGTSKFASTKSESRLWEKNAPAKPTTHATILNTLRKNPRTSPTRVVSEMMMMQAKSIQFIFLYGFSFKIGNIEALLNMLTK